MSPGDAAGPARNGAGTGDLLAGDQLNDTASVAESAVVGVLVLGTADSQDEMLAAVEDSDFIGVRCAFGVQTVRRMRGECLPVDQLTIVGYVQRHGLLGPGAPRMQLASWLHETAALAPVVASGTYYAGMVVEEAARRRVTETCTRLARLADGAALDELATEVRRELLGCLDILDRAGVRAEACPDRAVTR